MVATVGSISIDLSTNAAKFASGFKGAATTVEQQSSRMSKAVNGFTGSITKSSAALSGFVGGLAAGAVTAGLSALTGAFGKAKDAIAELDEIASNSRTVGLSTDSYQAFAFAAQQANVEQEGFNKALEIFAKNVGLAQEGTGALYGGLIKLNPELLRSVLNATNQRDRLAAVADALHNARDETEKAALATTIFGKAGIDMVRVLDGGAASLNDFEQKARDLGLIIDKGLIAQAEKLDDQLDILTRALDVQLKSALISLGPILTGTAQAFLAGAKGAADYAQHVGELGTAMRAFASDANSKNLADILLGPEGGGGIAGFFRDVVKTSEVSIDKINADMKKLREQIMKNTALGLDTADAERSLAKLQIQADELRESFKGMVVDLDTSEAKARVADLAQQFREAENASMTALGSPHLPAVHGGGGVDPAIMDDVEKAINDDTKTTSAGLSRVERAVQASGDSVAAALSYNVPSGGGYATGDSANSFKFSGSGNSSSWGGKRLTFGGGGSSGDAALSSQFSRWGPVNLLAARAGGTAMTADTSSLSSAGTATTGNVVNVVVKPVMVGDRLSAQSRAEIKQAAAEGTNVALRSYNGRA